jgi:hypothetical protein
MGTRSTRWEGDDDVVVIDLVADDPDDRSSVDPGLAVALDPSPLSVATERAVDAVRQLVGPGAGATGWAVSTEPGREAATNTVLVHHLLGPPNELAPAVARFLADRGGRVRSLWGTATLAPAESDRPVLCAWRGRLRLRTSFARIPFELEAEAWRSVGLVLTLRPARARDRRIGAHRRWAWFHTGHGVLEQVRRAVEDPCHTR